MNKRQKAKPYRFNGHPFLHSGSIRAVEIMKLEELVSVFETRLAIPNDPDDKKWTARWLTRFRKELRKKQAGRELKQRELRDRGRRDDRAVRAASRVKLS